MTFGEVQSAIQLTVALNALYLALIDVRAPAIRFETKALNDLSERCHARASNPAYAKDGVLGVRRSINDAIADLTKLTSSLETRDGWTGLLCTITIFVYLVLLIVSSYYYQTTVPEPWAFLIACTGFLPIAFGLLDNLLLVLRVRNTIRSKRVAAAQSLDSLNPIPTEPKEVSTTG